jgi:hypothetical protein
MLSQNSASQTSSATLGRSSPTIVHKVVRQPLGTCCDGRREVPPDRVEALVMLILLRLLERSMVLLTYAGTASRTPRT